MKQFAVLLQSRPFVVLLAPMICGISVASSLNYPVTVWAAFIPAFFCIFFALFLYLKPVFGKINLLFNFSLFFYVFFYAYNATIFETAKPGFLPDNRATCWVNAIFTDEPVFKNNKARAILLIDSAVPSTYNHVKVIARFTDDSMMRKIKPGYLFQGMLVINRISEVTNPYDFDYSGYMAKQQVYFTAYPADDKWIVKDSQKLFNITILAARARQYLLERFEKHHITGNELAVLSALTLGYKDMLDQHIRQAYSDSGAVHILAVSGMHAGMIYLLLLFLLRPIGNKKLKQRAEFYIGIPLIWLYALITGFSPSVIRASLMLSAIITGRVFSKPTDIYNTIAATAFIMLAVSPLLFFDAGFQLSFLAVTGIVAFYQPLYQLFNTDNYLLDNIWKLVAVAISAQILTFPVSLFHFHQFPNYFLISNIIIIPFATLIIYAGVLFLPVSFIPFISDVLSWLIKKGTATLNYLAGMIENLPGAVTTSIPMSLTEVIIIYLFIFFIIAYISKPVYRYLLLSVITIIIYFSVRLGFSYIAQNKNELIIWNKAGKMHYTIRAGLSLYLISDLDEEAAQKSVNKLLAVNRISRFNAVSQAEAAMISQWFARPDMKGYSQLLIAGYKKIVFCTDNRISFFKKPDKPLHCNILIVNHHFKISPYEMALYFNPDLIICDATFAVNELKKWEKYCVANGILFHSVQISGSYHTSL